MVLKLGVAEADPTLGRCQTAFFPVQTALTLFTSHAISKASSQSSLRCPPAAPPVRVARTQPLALRPGGVAFERGGAAAFAPGGVEEVDGGHRGREDAAGQGVGIFGWDRGMVIDVGWPKSWQGPKEPCRLR